MINRDEAFKWAAGVLGTLTTALVIWIASFLWNFERNVEAIAAEVHARGGVERRDIEDVQKILSSVESKLEAAGEDRREIREDIRQIVKILSAP